MTASRFSRTQKATALLPLALLSTAWTASLAGFGAMGTVAAASDSSLLPDGTSVPGEAIQAPASVTGDGVVAPSVPAGQEANAVRTASTSGIPSVALAAYQRAEAIINSADEACNLSWHLLAAIGRVESDHGRFGGNSLDEDGVARPGIYGIALDGTNGTRAIPDTDAGQYDNDTVWDRAVGPMQFIPSTWSVVGVDADGDGVRDPQNIHDAALAAAVYLCSGTDDLSTEAGQRSAVFRYNRSTRYVDLVLSIAEAYKQGNFSSVPNSTTSAAFFTPDPQYVGPSAGNKGKLSAKNKGGKNTTAAAPANPNPTPTSGASPAPGGGTEGGSTGGSTSPLPGTGGSGGTKTGGTLGSLAENPQATLEEIVKDPVKVVTDLVEDITTPLTQAEALAKCLETISALQLAKLEKCVSDLLGLN
ncbi:lytic transglycosylase domain-containing protein [Nocardioides limicola]|uniref:lytic transglycosylase domain-containing protein n=1 Tax=Nocardioides limicola TaxID=2803368 RepID=UPI00193C59DA|nr:lytic murein transglycosylase [Nocardioides sp. DJM-14]